MTKCGKSSLPECEYFATNGCVSPFNCPYKVENESITTATSTPCNLYPLETDKNKEISRLQAENAELRERLDKAIGLPVKVGDTIYMVFLDEIKEWQVEKTELCKDEYFVYGGHADTDDYTFVTSKEYGMLWFTDRAEAEARLKELQGGER